MNEKPAFLDKLSVLSVSICVICVLFFPQPVQAANLKKVSYTVTVTATVGQPVLTIFGYTSPQASVFAEGVGVGKQTFADDNGYFIFNQIFLPEPQERWVNPLKKELAYPEVYLYSVDTDGRSGQPFSLPPIPLGNYEISVGPVLLSPTLTLEKNLFLSGEQVVASGQTIPGSTLKVNLANNPTVLNWFLKKVLPWTPFIYFYPYQTEAYFIPEYQIQIKEDGHYQFNLPNNLSATTGWRIFTGTAFLDGFSAKSNTLNFRVVNRLEWLLEQFLGLLQGFWGLLKPYLWLMVVLVLSLFLVTLLVALRSQPRTSFRRRHLPKGTTLVSESGAKIFTRE